MSLTKKCLLATMSFQQLTRPKPHQPQQSLSMILKMIIKMRCLKKILNMVIKMRCLKMSGHCLKTSGVSLTPVLKPQMAGPGCYAQTESGGTQGLLSAYQKASITHEVVRNET